MNDLIQEIRSRYTTFTASNKKVANYILQNSNKIIFETLQTAASNAGVSTTTVVRFSKAFGFSGYAELQQTLINNVRGNIGIPERLISAAPADFQDKLYISFQKEMTGIADTLQSISSQNLKQAIDLALNAKDIYVLGIRTCFSLAFLFSTVLGQTRKNVRLVNSIASTYLEGIISAGTGDVCFVFAFPRFLKESSFLIRQMKRNGVKIVLMTEPSYSEIVNMADVVLYTSPSEVSFKGSFVPPVCVINYLISEIVDRSPEESLKTATQIENCLSQNYII